MNLVNREYEAYTLKVFLSTRKGFGDVKVPCRTKTTDFVNDVFDKTDSYFMGH